MIRLLVHVEGETEETFVNEVLRPHLSGVGFSSVSARIVGNNRQRERRGGIRGWDSVRKDILRHLKADAGVYATTFVDYYGLPQSGPGAWPGRAEASGRPFVEKAGVVESAISAAIVGELGPMEARNRFVPFVMMHEFEALLFSDCHAFARIVGRSGLAMALQEIRDQFATPEEINDSVTTAPSKRIEKLIPNYQKPLFGNLGAIEIGLASIREQCPHFAAWLKSLEQLAAAAQ